MTKLLRHLLPRAHYVLFEDPDIQGRVRMARRRVQDHLGDSFALGTKPVEYKNSNLSAAGGISWANTQHLAGIF
jgi:hypothetical protein